MIHNVVSGHTVSSVQFSHVRLFATPWTAARQASLSITSSRSSLRLTSIEPSHPLLSPSLPTFNLSQHQGFSSESIPCFRWPKYWSFSFSISSSNEYAGLTSFRMDWLDPLAVQVTLKSSPIPQFKSLNSSALSFLYSPTLTIIHNYWKNHSFDYMNLC